MVAQHRELLGGDLELGVPEPLGVLEADRGQRRRPARDHVGRVEAAAEPGLDHRHLDPRRREGDEGGRGRRPRTGSPPRPRRASGSTASTDVGDALDRGGEGGRRRSRRRRACIRSRPALVVRARGRRRRGSRAPRAAPRSISVTDDLPLVPTTWTEAKRCWGMPSTETSRRIRSSPKRQPSGSSEAPGSLRVFGGRAQVSRAPRARRR